jgi:molybdopterin-guanine dinucleotide biosynthesis protein A
MASSSESPGEALQAYSAGVCVGIFVGGASRRMGRPKGLLLEPEDIGRAGLPRRPLVLRLRSEAERALQELARPGHIVLVGERPEYLALGVPVLRDAAPQQGPLGGLVALLEEAQRRRWGTALALACDQPYVTAGLLKRVLCERRAAAVVAPHSDGFWQPLCARYDVATALPIARAALGAGRLSLQRLLVELGAAPLELTSAERAELQDWDEPDDVPAPLSGDEHSK